MASSTGVGEDIFVKISFPSKPFHTARAVLGTNVGEDVVVKMSTARKLSPTLLTLEVPSNNVGEAVHFEISHTSASCTAVVTPQPCPANMGEGVSGNGSFTGTRLPATVTAISPHPCGQLLLPVPFVCGCVLLHICHCNTVSSTTHVVGVVT